MRKHILASIPKLTMFKPPYYTKSHAQLSLRGYPSDSTLIQSITMSKKTSNLAGFYLVPVESYKTLSELRLKNEQLEKQLSESLKYKSLAASEKVVHLQSQVKKLEAELASLKNSKNNSAKISSQISSQHFQPTDVTEQQQQQQPQQQQQGGSLINVEQKGGSDVASSYDDDNGFRKKLFSSFETFLKTHKLIQSGSGPLDLTPTIPIPMVEKPEVKPSPENVTDLDVFNTDQTVTDNNSAENITTIDDLDEDKLIGSVKSRYKDKAKELLEEIKKHSDEISVESDGTISLKGRVLPDANFYDIFELLYRPVKNYRDKEALAAVVDALASLGLGHLILRFYTKGITPQGKGYLENRGKILNYLNQNKPWYYLGGNDD